MTGGKPHTDTLYHTIQPFVLINQYGDTITEKEYEGKIYVADFFFTTCQSICPKMTSQLYRVQEKFLKNDSVLLLSHTVDPEHDSVPVLARYAVQTHARPSKWNFVTGDKKHLYDLARQGYLITAMEGNGGPEDFIHSETFVLVDKERRIRGFYDGTSTVEVNKLIDDIKVLIAEYYMESQKEKSHER